MIEVDFVVEDAGGEVTPVEIKFRRKIENKHMVGLVHFMKRFKARHGIMVTRNTYSWNEEHKILCVPLMEFLLTF
jgi:predicted AAA+ superfamily ATPase